jgi:hypothetical protein
MANVVGSFFQCFVSCGALARTAVLESSGGKTQLVTVIASGIVALVMLWISPLLYTLPKVLFKMLNFNNNLICHHGILYKGLFGINYSRSSTWSIETT